MTLVDVPSSRGTRGIAMLLGVLVLCVVPARAPADGDEETASLEVLAHGLAEGDVAARRRAAWALWNRRDGAAPVLPALADALLDDDTYVRETCARTLAAIGWQTDDVVRRVAAALADARPEVRANAASILFSARPLPDVALDPFVERLLDPAADTPVRAAVLTILGRAPGAPAGLSAERVAAFARDGDDEVRRRAAFLLGRYENGDDDAIVLPLLIDALGDASAGVRLAAATCLSRRPLADPRIVPALGGLLDDPADYTVRYAALGLGRAGPVAAPWVPDLARVLDTREDDGARYAAATALGLILGPIQDAVLQARGALEREAAGPDRPSARAARESLARITGKARGDPSGPR